MKLAYKSHAPVTLDAADWNSLDYPTSDSHGNRRDSPNPHVPHIGHIRKHIVLPKEQSKYSQRNL